MDKQKLIEITTEKLKPFETSNLMETFQHLTLHQIFTHPIVLIVIISVLFFGIIKRNKTVLLTLVLLIGMIVIFRFAMPAEGEEMSMSSMFPFIGGGLLIGGIIIYFSLIKD